MSKAGVDVRFAGVLRFADDRLATFNCGFDAATESLEIIGRDGVLTLPDPWHSTTGVFYRNGQKIEVEPTNPYQLELQDVNAAIRGEREPLLGRADALGQSLTIEALYRAAETGTAVTLA